jgi:hypothetical protein
MNAEINIYSVQPLIKRKSVWIDHKTLFPVLEIGFFISDIQMKAAKCSGCRLCKLSEY